MQHLKMYDCFWHEFTPKGKNNAWFEQGVIGLIRCLHVAMKSEKNLFDTAEVYFLANCNNEIPSGSTSFATQLRHEWGVSDVNGPLNARLVELLCEIEADADLNKVRLFVTDHLGLDPAHDLEHTLRVAFWATQIAASNVKRKHLLAAALLHDLANLPNNYAVAGTSASQHSSNIAQNFLVNICFASQAEIKTICQAITEHNNNAAPTSALGNALHDASRLDALGLTGLIRLFIVGAQLGTLPFHPSDLWAQVRPLDDNNYTLDGLFTKLFELKNAMCTPNGRKEANVRIAAIQMFVEHAKYVGTFHLTAKSVVGRSFSPDVFGGVKVALLGFCPPPHALDRYILSSLPEQYFIHVSPSSVKMISCAAGPVLSLHHIYGGPVASATVEELAYYGVKYILAYGLAGGLGNSPCGMHECYIVQDALAADGTTPHYTQATIVKADISLYQLVQRLWKQKKKLLLHSIRAATGDAIYREDQALLHSFRARDCHAVNLDSAHLYAVAQTNGENMHIAAVQCGVISDVVSEIPEKAQTSLSAMLGKNQHAKCIQMDRVSEIFTFYLESVAPMLARNECI